MFYSARFFVGEPSVTKYYFTEHLHEVAIGLVLLYYFKETNKINLLVALFIVFSAFAALIAIREGGLIWEHNFLQDENQISALLNMLIPVTIFYSLTVKKTIYKLLCYLAVALQLAEIVVSVSRGGFIALVVIGASMALFTKRKLLISTLAIITVIGVVLFAPPRFFSEIQTIRAGTEEATAHARAEYWRRAMVMFSEDPVFGKGIAQFPVLSHLYALPGKILDEGDYLVCHSNWFQILSELGIVGMILYLTIFYHFFKGAYLITRKYKIRGETVLGPYEYSFYRNVSIGLTIGMIGFMVAGSFINILIFPYYYTMIFLMMLVKTAFLEKLENADQPVLTD
jgi:O-antigen ligase